MSRADRAALAPAALAWLLCAIAAPALPSAYWYAAPIPYALFAWLAAQPHLRALAWLGWATTATALCLLLAARVDWPVALPTLLAWLVPPLFERGPSNGGAVAIRIALWSAIASATGLACGT